MKFCDNCNNIYYISIEETGSNNLTYYCRNCGKVDSILTEEGVCVLNTQFKKNVQNFNHIINKYTKMDPTLPRIYNMKCPNSNCITNHSENKIPVEIIYMRYDDNNMKYLYICSTCDITWKTDDNK